MYRTWWSILLPLGLTVFKIPQRCATTCHGRVKDENACNEDTNLLPEKWQIFGRWWKWNGVLDEKLLVPLASKEIPLVLRNLTFLYRAHDRPPLVPILIQMNPTNTLDPTFLRSILILLSHLHLGFPSRLFPSGFPTKTLHAPLPSLIRATWPAHLVHLAWITWIILRECYK